MRYGFLIDNNSYLLVIDNDLKSYEEAEKFAKEVLEKTKIGPFNIVESGGKYYLVNVIFIDISNIDKETLDFIRKEYEERIKQALSKGKRKKKNEETTTLQEMKKNQTQELKPSEEIVNKAIEKISRKRKSRRKRKKK